MESMKLRSSLEVMILHHR